jgi:Ser-tRNA(Ala) deacylase AlaX
MDDNRVAKIATKKMGNQTSQTTRMVVLPNVDESPDVNVDSTRTGTLDKIQNTVLKKKTKKKEKE